MPGPPLRGGLAISDFEASRMSQLRSSWRRRRLRSVLLLKSVYTSLGVEELLLSCVEWMTLRAHTDTNLWDRSSGLEGLAATTAVNGSFVICGMNILFHSGGTVLHPPYKCQHCALVWTLVGAAL